MQLDLLTEGDWPVVAAIYREGIATGHATFADEPPATWAAWSAGKLHACSLVARTGGVVVGWAAISPTSTRSCYAGVAEHSLYVAASARGAGVGARLLEELIRVSEAAGIWMLQSSIFPENVASRALHARYGFREVSTRERIALMTYGLAAGCWRDSILLERRSVTVGS